MWVACSARDGRKAVGKYKITVKGKDNYTGTLTKTIKKLKKGKVYQIKVRAYKKVNGVTYYGAWSKVKTTKKVK